MPRLLRRAVAPIAVLSVALVVLAGCTGSTDPGPKATRTHSSPSTVAAPTPELQEFYTQQVDWKACSEADQCATVTVPLDYADPTGPTVDLAIARILAQGDAVGSILVNPGGPGASAIDFLSSAPYLFSAELLDEYDIVAFDPRGVSRTTPVTCYDGPAMDTLIAADFDLSTDDGVAQQTAAWGAFGEACAKNTGDALAHVDTVTAARDMDVVRAVVGDPALNYLGYSYGTKLGATYAALFPKQVGRVVLDSVLDPTLTSEEVSAGQAEGFEGALRAYAQDCLGGSGCPMTGDVDHALSQIRTMLDRTHTSPLPTGTSRRLTAPLAFTGIAYPLYSQYSWPDLTSALTLALQGDGSGLLQLADAYYERSADGTFATNTTEAFSAINCADYDRGTGDVAAMRASATAIEAAAPTVGSFFGFSDTLCQDWPVPAVGGLDDYSATGAAPILVLGTTNDPATPYVWAQSTAAMLSSAVLVTHVGEGHGVYGMGNACATAIVDDYFLDGTVPATGTTC